MLYAGLDIHKAVFQVVVLDPDSGELCECRFEPSRERLGDWAMEWQGKLAAVAIEATTGWRWVARELEAHGFEVHLVDPGRASALRGRRRQPKTDRLDARWRRPAWRWPRWRPGTATGSSRTALTSGLRPLLLGEIGEMVSQQSPPTSARTSTPDARARTRAQLLAVGR